MTWKEALLARVRAAAGVTALVGARSYWEEAPQSAALPYITLNDITQLRPQTLNDWDLRWSRVQINAHALTYASKDAIIEAAVSALVSGGTFNGHIFHRAEIDRIGDAAPVTDGAMTVRTIQADLLIHHTPA